MSPSVILDNLLNPPILFFFLGALATLVRSDLQVPQPIARFLALYLLLAIGLKGGVELRTGDTTIWATLAAAMLMAALVPLYSFFILRRRVNVANAAAICANLTVRSVPSPLLPQPIFCVALESSQAGPWWRRWR